MAGMAWFLTGLGLYLAAGAVFAPWFALRGAGRLDANARAGTAGFRVLIAPGAAALWPLLLAMVLWRRDTPDARVPSGERAHRRVHLFAWVILVPAAMGLIIWAWSAGVDPASAVTP